MEEKSISFSTQITEQDLYRYNLHHSYTSSQGVFSILVSGLLVAAWILQFVNLSALYRVLYPMIALLFLLYIPMNLRIRVKQQMLQDVFSHPLTYTLSESGLVISSPVAEEPAELPWDYIYKIVTWKGYLLIYSNRVNAYIIPMESIESQYESIVSFIKEHVEDYKITIK